MFRALQSSHSLDLHVAFCSDFGLKAYSDKEFGAEVKWDTPLLAGYGHEFIKNYSWSPNQSTFFGLFNPGLVTLIRTGDWDAVWVQGWANLSYWIAMMTCFLSGIPVLLRAETQSMVDAQGPKLKLKQAILRPLFRRISHFLAIGSHGRTFYLGYGVPTSKISIAPYTVDNEFFASRVAAAKPNRGALRHQVGVQGEVCVFLFCGKLIPKKQPLQLLEAFASMAKRNSSFLLYVGDGELRQELEARAKASGLNNIFVTGFKNQSELPSYLALSDVFVLPSSFEPWGLVVNEAMNANLPVIVSDRVGAGGDLVMEAQNGFIVPHDDVSLLRDKMDWLAAHPEERKQMGLASGTVIRDWNYEAVVAATLSALQLVASPTKPR